jgi:flagellar hook-length control protein FliK
MLPVNLEFDPATSLNAPCPAPKGGGATPAATGPGSFHTMLRDVAAAKAAAPANTAPPHREDAVNETDRGAAADKSHARPTRRQNLTAGAETNAVAVEAPANTAPAHRKDAVNETGCGAAADDSHTQPTRRSAANDTAGQPLWALLAQIIQNLNAAADTNAVVVEGEGAAVASGPAAGDAAKDLAALVDLLKQLQESPAALTAESVIPLDRLRQVLEQWQAGANESQPTGLPGRLLDLLKNVQDGLPGIAWDRWAAALESQDGAAAKVALETVSPVGAKASQDGAAAKVVFETASPSGAGLISAAGSQHDGLPIGAGRAARGVLLDAKATPVVAGKADAAVGADELSDQDRPAADERGPGAGRVMPALPPAASMPAETLRSTAVSSKAQASEGSFALPRNFEAASDTQSEVSDDSRSPADKATVGHALSTADGIAEEDGSPSLRFDAALRDVRSFAVPEGSPDKPAEAAAAVKGRDTAAAPVKADVFDQIVQRAAVHVKNDQGEMRIDLKPEFLGHVRLQIVTENQQVTVRILTELPMVRDMIESNIQQLKSDLQQQGLRVERVEVAVADDPREHPGRQAWTGAGRKGHADGDVAPAAAEISAGLRPEAAYRWGLGGQTTINMFA